MAGRGRGRGKGFSFDIQNLGINRTDDILQTTAPPPLFSPLISNPQPLCENERVTSRAEILKKLLDRQNDDPYGINIATKALRKNDVERYIEIFKPKSSNTYKWDKRLFPEELFAEKPKRKNGLKPDIPNKRLKLDIDISKKLESLEEKDDAAAAEQNKDDEEQDSEQGSDIVNDDDDLDDDELLEESADYVSSYFDNGEGYLEEEENLDGDDNL